MSVRRSTAPVAQTPADRHARARRILRWATLGAALVWLLTFAAGPLLHQIGHSDDHVHLPSGAVVKLAHAPDRDAPVHDAPADPLDHGGGSLAHLGASAVLIGGATFALDVARVSYADAPPSPTSDAPSPRWARPRAPRGPPASPA